jgi:hypothetical protein
MLYEDPVTGALHEVPDSQVGWGYAEDPYSMGEVVYDGLGNPVGFSFRKAFGKLVKKAVPFATSMLGPYGQIINRALPLVRQALGPVAQRAALAARQQALQQLSGYGEAQPMMAPVPMTPMAVAPPPGAAMGPMAGRRPGHWVRPPVPYTGLRGRRLYLRCAAWPGPKGLVPAGAAQGVATPMQPGPPTVVAPPAPGAPRGRYGRSRYRRR